MNYWFFPIFVVFSLAVSQTRAQNCVTSQNPSGCKNGGVCVNALINGVPTPKCLCPAGYNQPRCDPAPVLSVTLCGSTCKTGNNQ